MHVDRKLISTRLQRIDRLGAHQRDMLPGLQQPDGLATEVKSKIWRLRKCKACYSSAEESKMVSCSECKARYHIYCLTPPLISVPKESWTCKVCVEQKKHSFGFGHGRIYDLNEYKNRGDAFKREWYRVKKGSEKSISRKKIEKNFWDIVRKGAPAVEVEYGSELDVTVCGSGFPLKGELSDHPWNLNNLGRSDGSVLKHLDDIAGITIPWLYVGMMFSSFCWHNEDHYCYSISYNHTGAPKQWYGIPGSCAANFEAMMKNKYPRLLDRQPDLLFQLVTLVSPKELKKSKVSVSKATHRPGEFIVTFPQAYHAGFNYGFNVAEAVNFACPDWVSWGARAVEHYRLFRRVPVFSHDELLVRIALNNPTVETAAWVRNGLLRLREVEYSMRQKLFNQGLTLGVRWPGHEKREPKKRDRVRKRKYRNVVHKTDWKYSRDGTRVKGFMPTVNEAELGGYCTSEEPCQCVGYLNRCFGTPNGNSQDHCAICNYPLYVSAVYCSCNPNLSCLHHASELCSCELSKKHIRYRLSLWELDLVANIPSEILKGNIDEKVGLILEESSSVFDYTSGDSKINEHQQVLLGEGWIKRSEDILSSENFNRELLVELLTEGRKYIWGSSRLHSCRATFQKLLNLEVVLQQVSKYLNPVKGYQSTSMENEKRPHIEELECFAEKARALPEKLKGTECKQFFGLLREAQEIRASLRDAVADRLLQEGISARRRRNKLSWLKIQDLLAKSIQSICAIPEQHVLQKKMDLVKEWLKTYSALIQDAEGHSTFTSVKTQALVASKSLGTIMNREKRKRQYTTLNDYEKVTVRKARPNRMSVKECKEFLSQAGGLPVHLEMEIIDIKKLLDDAQGFHIRAREHFQKERQGNYSRFKYKEFCSSFLADDVGSLLSGNFSQKIPVVTPTKVLLSLFSDVAIVALHTNYEGKIYERLDKLVQWERESSKFLNLLDTTNCCKGSVEGAIALLQNHAQWKLPSVKNVISLEHVLAWKSLSSKLEHELQGVKDLTELERLDNMIRKMLAMEKHMVWNRRNAKKAKPQNKNLSGSNKLSLKFRISQKHKGKKFDLTNKITKKENQIISVPMSSYLMALGEPLAQKMYNCLRVGRELRDRCMRILNGRIEDVNHTEEKFIKTESGSSLAAVKIENSVKCETSKDFEDIKMEVEPEERKATLGDVRILLDKIRTSKFKNVHENELAQLEADVKAWKRLVRESIPDLSEEKDGNDTRKSLSLDEIQALKEEGLKKPIELPYLQNIDYHLEKIRRLGDLFCSRISVLLPNIHHRIVESDALQGNCLNSVECIVSEIIPEITGHVERVKKSKIKFSPGHRIMSLAWCLNVFLALNGTPKFSELTTLDNADRKEYREAYASKDLIEIRDGFPERYEQERSLYEYVNKFLTARIQVGQEWLKRLDVECSKLSSIPKLYSLQEEAKKFPVRMTEVCKIGNLIRRARLWLLKAKSTFPEIFGGDSLGLSFSEVGIVENMKFNRDLNSARKILAEARACAISLQSVERLAVIIDYGDNLIKDLDRLFQPRPRYLSLKNAMHQILLSLPMGITLKEQVLNRFGDNKKDEKGQDLYCVCRKPMPKKNSAMNMICCDFCDEWFHSHCVNLTAANVRSLQKSEDKFRCPKCCEKKKVKYRYGNPRITTSKPKYSELIRLSDAYSSYGYFELVEYEMLDILLRVAEYERVALEKTMNLFNPSPNGNNDSNGTESNGSTNIKDLESRLLTIQKVNTTFDEEKKAMFLLWKANVSNALSKSSNLKDLEAMLVYYNLELKQQLPSKPGGQEATTPPKDDSKDTKLNEQEHLGTEESEKKIVNSQNIDDMDTENGVAEEKDQPQCDEKATPSRISRKRRRAKANIKKKSKKMKPVAPKPEVVLDDVHELRVLYDRVQKGKKLRRMATRGLREKWKPGSYHAKKFLQLEKELGYRVVSDPIERLKEKLTLYCLCLSPYVEGIFMIGCDKCSDWFHPKCVGLTDAEAEQLEDYTCPRCSKK